MIFVLLQLMLGITMLASSIYNCQHCTKVFEGFVMNAKSVMKLPSLKSVNEVQAEVHSGIGPHYRTVRDTIK